MFLVQLYINNGYGVKISLSSYSYYTMPFKNNLNMKLFVLINQLWSNYLAKQETSSDKTLFINPIDERVIPIPTGIITRFINQNEQKVSIPLVTLKERHAPLRGIRTAPIFILAVRMITRRFPMLLLRDASMRTAYGPYADPSRKSCPVHMVTGPLRQRYYWRSVKYDYHTLQAS
jgi:hypothetical protein